MIDFTDIPHLVFIQGWRNKIYLGEARDVLMEQAGQNDFHILEAPKLGELCPSGTPQFCRPYTFMQLNPAVS